MSAEEPKRRRIAQLLIVLLLVLGIALVGVAVAAVSFVEVITTENVWGEDRPIGVVVETTCGTILNPVLDCDANRDRVNRATVVVGIGMVLCAAAYSVWALGRQRRPMAAIASAAVLIPLAIGGTWLWRSAVIAYYEHRLS